METNAPEKIYVHKSQYWGLMANEHNITKDGIEYIRTDAFIEKAAAWLRNSGIIKDNSGGYEREYIINKFKESMKRK